MNVVMAPRMSSVKACRDRRHSTCGCMQMRRKDRLWSVSDRLLNDLVDAVKDIVRKETVGPTARRVPDRRHREGQRARVIERLRELANDSRNPSRCTSTPRAATSPMAWPSTTPCVSSVARGIEVTIVVQGMAYSMGSVVLQAASPGRRLALPHSWIMIHEPAKWAGWQSTSAAAQHLDRLKQMQSQIYQHPRRRVRPAAQRRSSGTLSERTSTSTRRRTNMA